MHTRTNYITGRTSEFDEFRESIPVHLEAGGFLLCTSGCGDVVVDSKQYSVKKWDLIVAFPHSYAHAIHTSDDFDGVIFGIDMDILINTEISNRSLYITSITTNPCISLRSDEAQKILALRDSFLVESANQEHPHRKEIDEAILKIIIYEVAALFRHSKPNEEHERSRNDAIFNNFVLQLYSGESQARDLEHYAQRQSITPSHLSRVIKRVSGRPASIWISNYTIVCIKRLLQNKELPIATIAEELNFPNASFLAQYFKKYTSQTPKQYRMEFFSGAIAQ
ncbi:MAG: helix-turn-helix domain-containing protein [Rikenellaceae bacterium]